MKKVEQGKVEKEKKLKEVSSIQEKDITDNLSAEDLNKVQGGVAPILGPIK